jgi:hypothetical protein
MDPRVKPEGDKGVCHLQGAMNIHPVLGWALTMDPRVEPEGDDLVGGAVRPPLPSQDINHLSLVTLGLDPRVHRGYQAGSPTEMKDE